MLRVPLEDGPARATHLEKRLGTDPPIPNSIAVRTTAGAERPAWLQRHLVASVRHISPQPHAAKVVSPPLESVLLKAHLNSGSGMGPVGLVPACELRPHAPQSQDK